MPRDGTPAGLARAGDLDGLLAALRERGGRNVDRDSYRWLCAAADFGHEEADELISDLVEHTSLRYDDSGWERAAAHWELALGYLGGREGLPHDLELAETHLDLAFGFAPGRAVLDAINEGCKESFSADAALTETSGEGRRLLERVLAGDPARRVAHFAERVERLVTLHAPRVVIEGEVSLLREAVASMGDGSLEDVLRERVRDVLERARDRVP